MAYTCPACHDTFLFQPQHCPTCSAQVGKQQRSARARERRASYDTKGKVAEAEFWQLLRLYPCCPCCGTSWSRTEGAIARDHIIPLSRGGPNELANLQPLCQACNLAKSDRLIYFSRAMPGRPAPLPPTLWPLFRTLAHYQPQPQMPDQLSLMPIASADCYPEASFDRLEALTLEHTLDAIAAGEDEVSSA